MAGRSDEEMRRIYDLCTHGTFDAVKDQLRSLVEGPQKKGDVVKQQEVVNTTVAWIGLGAMGSAMVDRIETKAPGNVRRWNRSAHPLRNVDSPKEACQNASIVFSMLANDSAVREVALGRGGLLESMAPGAIHVSFSTISPVLVEELNRAHKASGQIFVSCPVFGRPDSAEKVAACSFVS